MTAATTLDDILFRKPGSDEILKDRLHFEETFLEELGKKLRDASLLIPKDEENPSGKILVSFGMVYFNDCSAVYKTVSKADGSFEPMTIQEDERFCMCPFSGTVEQLFSFYLWFYFGRE